MKKLFVGGFGGSGTRVVQMLLYQAGYFVGQPLINGAFDYMGPYKNFVALYDKYHFSGDEEGFDVVLKCATMYRRSWSLKHGHFMYCIDLLKDWYPDSEFIFVMRNPIDNSLNKHNTWYRYGGLCLDATLEEKVKYYLQVCREVIPKADYTLRLENICDDPKNEIENLLNFASVPSYKYRMDEMLKLIKKPKSVGAGEKYYSKIDVSEVGY